MIEVLKGRFVAYRMNPADSSAIVEGWLVHAPGTHPLWEHYLVASAHLRDMPNCSRAVKRFAEATHELAVYAIENHPSLNPKDIGTLKYLTPPNVVWQFDSTDDDAVGVIVRSLVRECIDYANQNTVLSMCLEPEGVRVNGISAREYWRERLKVLLPQGARIE